MSLSLSALWQLGKSRTDGNEWQHISPFTSEFGKFKEFHRSSELIILPTFCSSCSWEVLLDFLTNCVIKLCRNKKKKKKNQHFFHGRTIFHALAYFFSWLMNTFPSQNNQSVIITQIWREPISATEASFYSAKYGNVKLCACLC